MDALLETLSPEIVFSASLALGTCMWFSKRKGGCVRDDAGGDLEKLNALMQEDFEWMLADLPEFASQAGFHEHSSKLQHVRPSDFEKTKQHSQEVLEQLRAIDRNALPTDDDKLNFDLFKSCHEDLIESLGTQLYFCSLNSMHHDGPLNNIFEVVELMRFESSKDYERYFDRLGELPRQIDEYIELLREGVKRGMVISKVMFEGVPSQLEGLVAEDNTYPKLTAPLEKAPAEWKQKISDRISQLVRKSYLKFQKFIQEEYEPHLRENPGCDTLSNGKEIYRICLKYHTGTNFTAEEIHQMGLDEVARIKKRMQKIMDEENFTGTAAEFGKFLGDQEQFKFQGPDDVKQHYEKMCAHIETLLPQYFSVFPENDLVIKTDTGGPAAFYLVGSPDGSRKGCFRVNLEADQPRYASKALTAHEAIPGHHMHCSMMVENTKLPNFRRYIEDRRYDIMPCKMPMYTSSFEGWALYCEGLAEEMDLYEDNYELWGRLGMEMMRAVRLVVDTGLHAKQMKIEEAIDFFVEASGMSRHECESEVKRYCTWPGQATGYKVGEIVIRNLRKELEARPDFNLTKFHDAILLAGALPLSGPCSLQTVVKRMLKI